MEELELEAQEMACEEYNTDNPTDEQVQTCLERMIEMIELNAENYYNQDGGN